MLKLSHQVQPTLKGRRSHKDVNTKRWDYWGPSCRLPITPTKQQGCWFICQIPFLLVESCSWWAFLVLVLNVLFPGKPLSPQQTRTVGSLSMNKVCYLDTIESRNHDMLNSRKMLRDGVPGSIIPTAEMQDGDVA